MSCCTPAGLSNVFGPDAARRDARRYRRKGLNATAAWLRERLVRGGVEGCTLLEVGGGIGSLQIELLEAGAERAVNVELVESYEPVARELGREHALEGRIERRVGDLVQQPQLAPAADIVVMHRVVCCYPDAQRLVGAACAHARERLALTLPRDSWWVRLGFWGMNAWLRLRRIAFRGYVHPVDGVLRDCAEHGFRVADHSSGLLWRSVLLRRQDAPRP